MTQEDKQLLLVDLCSRLPYEVMCQMKDEMRFIGEESPYYNYILSERHIELFRRHKGFYIKPYLRPMSSMTEEEEKEICQFMKDYNLLPGLNKAAVFCGEITDWLNKKMFDYRGLISKDLAISTEVFNPYKD